MNLFKVFDIAGSGMSAQSVRLGTTASNLANADTVGTRPEDAYHARQPVFQSLLDQSGNAGIGGVRILGVVESARPPVPEFDPGHPLANDDGYVFRSNVNIAEEMTNMISASRTFQNNAEVLNTSRQLLMQTLQLGK
jgi:flagellar basal-body rod protein FlgC